MNRQNPADTSPHMIVAYTKTEPDGRKAVHAQLVFSMHDGEPHWTLSNHEGLLGSGSCDSPMDDDTSLVQQYAPAELEGARRYPSKEYLGQLQERFKDSGLTPEVHWDEVKPSQNTFPVKETGLAATVKSLFAFRIRKSVSPGHIAQPGGVAIQTQHPPFHPFTPAPFTGSDNPEHAPAFYSRLYNVAAQHLPDKIDHQRFQGWLGQLGQKHGVAKDEVDWSGIHDFAQQKQAAGERHIDKGELLQHLRDNMPRIYEHVNDNQEPDQDSIEDHYRTIQDAEHAHDLAWAKYNGALRKDIESSPNRSGRDEIYEHLNRGTDALPSLMKHGFSSKVIEAYKELAHANLQRKHVTEQGRAFEDRNTQWGLHDYPSEQLEVPGGQNYKELLLKAPYLPGTFQHPHWDSHKNVLVHTRFNERPDIDGKKLLFLEELQSDWHQNGREKGYKTDVPVSRKFFVEETPEGHWNVKDEHGQIWTQTTRKERADERAGELSNQGGATHPSASSIPNAPFKNTSDWMGLGLKRMIRWAAEHGHDRLAWTTGRQQYNRYKDMTDNHVDTIHWTRNESKPGEQPTYHVEVHKDGEPQLSQTMNHDELFNHLGHNMASQIVNSSDNQGKLEGDDLSVNQSGFAHAYDKMMPEIAAKLGKKYGAKVGATHIENPSAPRYVIQHKDGSINEAKFNNLDAANERLKRMSAGGFTGARIIENPDYMKREPVHYLEITPALREAVLKEGLPLFK